MEQKNLGVVTLESYAHHCKNIMKWIKSYTSDLVTNETLMGKRTMEGMGSKIMVTLNEQSEVKEKTFK